MSQRGLVLGLVFGVASVADAGTVTNLELVPASPGPYAPGDTVDVDIILHNHEGTTIQLRLAQLDFAATDPAFTIADFDFNTTINGVDLYEHFPTDFAGGETTANVTWSLGGGPIAGLMLSVPDGGSLSLGTVNVTLPDAPGSYSLDVVNPDASDANTGARFDYSFDDRVTLWPVPGGHMDFSTPEPATLALLGVGGLALLCRRRNAQALEPKHWA